MRVGQNPNRNEKVQIYAPAVVSAIVHLPQLLTGYHKQRFEVVQLSLETMRKNAGMECKVMVWDNGSCVAFRSWLLGEYKPDYVVLSENIGKASARAGIVRMLPPDTIVGVADDDVFYYPDWLTAQIDLLKHFPNVGQVSGCPIRTHARWGNKNTLAWAKENAKLEYLKKIPAEYEMDFCKSIGRDYAFHVNYTAKDYDPIIRWGGKVAIGTAHHFQFIGYAGVLAPIVSWDIEAMSDEKPFDNAVDAAGYLRLTTLKRYTRHIGNVMDDDIREEAKRYA